MKVTQNGGQWKLYAFAPQMDLNYSVCSDYGS